MTTLNEILTSINPQLASAVNANPWLLYVIIFQVLFKIILYPIALYLAGKKQSKLWFIALFVCLLILNDFGLVALVYIIVTNIRRKVIPILPRKEKPIKKVSKVRKK
jgi:hypothetical protein